MDSPRLFVRLRSSFFLLFFLGLLLGPSLWLAPAASWLFPPRAATKNGKSSSSSSPNPVSPLVSSGSLSESSQTGVSPSPSASSDDRASEGSSSSAAPPASVHSATTKQQSAPSGASRPQVPSLPAPLAVPSHPGSRTEIEKAMLTKIVADLLTHQANRLSFKVLDDAQIRTAAPYVILDHIVGGYRAALSDLKLVLPPLSTLDLAVELLPHFVWKGFWTDLEEDPLHAASVEHKLFDWTHPPLLSTPSFGGPLTAQEADEFPETEHGLYLRKMADQFVSTLKPGMLNISEEELQPLKHPLARQLFVVQRIREQVGARLSKNLGTKFLQHAAADAGSGVSTPEASPTLWSKLARVFQRMRAWEKRGTSEDEMGGEIRPHRRATQLNIRVESIPTRDVNLLLEYAAAVSVLQRLQHPGAQGLLPGNRSLEGLIDGKQEAEVARTAQAAKMWRDKKRAQHLRTIYCVQLLVLSVAALAVAWSYRGGDETNAARKRKRPKISKRRKRNKIRGAVNHPKRTGESDSPEFANAQSSEESDIEPAGHLQLGMKQKVSPLKTF
ncbi:putative transmembrane protein [Toxoplasma gondii RUB]|uniref:Putative transmembrane protein n=2 Tax=Toxoplasma gondii TaxID=5811 RepID=A0A086M9T2_TOXGO|nr:putative transmembrane protein [Toxoplasma gondii p89]KFG65650.1 putative transmembrane protein [Toxoplasma gondii RUB]